MNRKNAVETIFDTNALLSYSRITREEGAISFLRGAVPRAWAIGPLFGIAQTVYYLGVGETLFGIPRLRPV